MAIGRQSNYNSERAAAEAASATAANAHDDLTLRNFKLGCCDIQRELEDFHKRKQRDIEHCFQKLIDNIPKEIVNASINYCIECYADFCEEEKDKATTDIVTADAAQTNVSSAKQSKANTIEVIEPIEKLPHAPSVVEAETEVNSCIIDESVSETVQVPEKEVVAAAAAATGGAKKKQKATKTESSSSKTVIAANNEDIAVKILYVLKDLSQVSTKLCDLKQLDMSKVHDACLDDIKLVMEALHNKK